MSTRLLRALGLLTFIGLAGCSGDTEEAEEAPPLHPVSGTVMLDGEPAVGVAVTFMPAGTTEGGLAYGITDESGKFSLTYENDEPGCPAGDFVATFSKVAMSDGSPIPEGKTAADVDAVQVIPDRFRIYDPQNRMMQRSVPEGGAEFEFEIQSE